MSESAQWCAAGAGGIHTGRELEALAVLLYRISDARRLHGRVGVRIGHLDAAPAPVSEGQPPLRAVP